MGIFDRLKGKAKEHPDQVEKGLDKAGQFADDKTGGKHSEQINKAEDKAGDYLGSDQGSDNPDANR
jgi:antitoxin protein of toxin-antitoxin system